MTCYTRACARVLVVGFALILPSSAGAVTIQRMDGRPLARYQRLVDRSPAPTRDGVVRVAYGARYTEYTDDRVIHVRSGRPMTDDEFFHELGHDYQAIVTDVGFDIWRLWVGVRQTRWQVSSYDYAPENYHSTRWMAQEYFADWYAGCATSGYSTQQVSWHSPLLRGSYDGWSVTPAIWRASCRRIYRLPRGES